MPLFSLDKITFSKGGTLILDNLSASFASPGPCLLMGPNGCGKTTLLRLLDGLESLDTNSGRIIWHDKSLSQRHNRSFVFQSPILLRRTVLDNIAYPQLLRSKPIREARSLAADLADRLGIYEKRFSSAYDLSGGERQKLALARALITEPKLLFLDEPTANIDDRSTREIEDILQKVSDAGTFVLMSSHDRSQSHRLSRSVLFMHRGCILDADSPTARAYFRGDTVG